MTKQNLTDITIILDKSGSMSTDAERTRSAINEFISGQKVVDGECLLSLVTFDAPEKYRLWNDGRQHNWYNQIWNAINIKEISQLSADNYVPSGGTALYDAVGRTIENIGARLRALPEHQRPGKVLIVIMTDGEENSSKEYTLYKLKEMIQHQENVYSWNFVFLGADFDTTKVTSSLGLDSEARSYNFNKMDLVKSYRGLSAAVGDYRTGSQSKLDINFSKQVKSYADKEDNSIKTS